MQRLGLSLLALLLTAPSSFAVDSLIIAPHGSVTVMQGGQGAPAAISFAPRENDVLAESPPEVSITFSRPVRASASSIRVYDPFGAKIAGGRVIGNGSNIAVELPPLKPGRYRVSWRAEFDGLIREQHGRYYFTVKK